MIILKYTLDVISLLESLHLFPIFRAVKAFKNSLSFNIFNDMDPLSSSFLFQPHLPSLSIFSNTRALATEKQPVLFRSYHAHIWALEHVMLPLHSAHSHSSFIRINWCNSLRPLSQKQKFLLILFFILEVSIWYIFTSLYPQEKCNFLSHSPYLCYLYLFIALVSMGSNSQVLNKG